MLTLKHKTIIFITIFLLLISVNSIGETGFDIVFLDVGQGECIIVKCDGHSMVVDAGTKNKGRDIQETLFKLGIDQIDIVVATHPDRDHNIYLDELIMLYLPTTIILSPIEDRTTNTYYQAVIDAAEEYGVNKEYPFVGDSYELGSATITIYGPHPVLYSIDDNWSVVLMVEYQGIRFLLTGDAEINAEMDMLIYNDLYPLKADVLKVGKHGSDKASSFDFIAAVSPQIAIISCAENNRYGYPHGDTIMNLLDNGTKDIRMTWKEGNIYFTVVEGILLENDLL